MKIRMVAAAVLAAAVPLWSGGCATMGGAETAVIRAKDEVFPALVHIRPVKEVYTSGQRREVLAVGSGFIISPDGYVVTNEHVAGESSLVQCVLSDKEEVEAEVVGVDPYTDVAVLKLNVDHRLPYVSFGNSDRVEAGNMVIAMGSPHGLSRSVSLGIISVTDRYLENRGQMQSPFNSWLQTDAAINPGNSGGPLINLRGEVIGVNARVLRGAENVGFAIPSNIVKDVVEDIIEFGRVQRSWLGLDLQEMLARTEDPTQRGVVVAGIDPLSPATDSGIRPGDVLVAVNGDEVHARFEEDLPGVRRVIANLPVGQEVTLTVQRGDELNEFTMTTEERSGLKGEELAFEEWGFTARELTPEVIRQAQLDSRDGIYVTGRQVGGIADNARLGQGDIILRVDDTPVENLAQFQELYEQLVASEKKLVMLFVKRGALTRYVLIKQTPDEENAANPMGDEADAE